MNRHPPRRVPTMRGVIAAALLCVALAGARSDPISARETDMTIKLSSTAFAANGEIPRLYT